MSRKINYSLDEKLKKDASQQITKNFIIVKTDDFSVREGKTVN